MVNFKPKQCVVCGTEYLPTGRCSKYCTDCRDSEYSRTQKLAREEWRKRREPNYGKGSGCSTGVGEANPMYSHGQCTFRRWAKEKKDAGGTCEKCGVSLKEATHYEWVGHHRDHNRMNNTTENLVLLCKKCHQIEHTCWKNFKV